MRDNPGVIILAAFHGCTFFFSKGDEVRSVFVL